uniref:Uncharacterized protein n=1 Tax=Strigamia maritima TaxID=126957 RepID=T1ILN3_STRMM
MRPMRLPRYARYHEKTPEKQVFIDTIQNTNRLSVRIAADITMTTIKIVALLLVLLASTVVANINSIKEGVHCKKIYNLFIKNFKLDKVDDFDKIVSLVFYAN